jgi:hypothetical protein
VPVPFACVFHPAKLNPVFSREPVFPNTVTLEPNMRGEVSVGTFPLVLLLPLYVTVYIGGGGGRQPQPYALLSFAKPDRLLLAIYNNTRYIIGFV